MFGASALEGTELTKTLGFQVRRAVELFVAALSSADREERLRQGRGPLDTVPPHDVYVAAATVMMRAIFLLYAEERGLLPLDDPLYARAYALSTLREQIETERLESGDEPLERRCYAWRRMLATFAAVYGGISHDRLRMPAYGGRLFDPARFPFLLDARIDDLTIATMLSALQILEPERGAAARRLSFRELDVEQIGHVYEGLLDHDARSAEDVVLGFTGKSGDEPEVDLAAIEANAARGRDALVEFLVETTGRAAKAVARDLDRGAALARDKDVETTRRIRRACENDVGLAERVMPYSPFLRDDLHGVPTVYLPGSLLVRKTRARRDSGTEYTPRVLAEEIVLYTLEPLCFRPGPIEGAERRDWAIKPSEELLALKVCDPACGSGAFLVAACRYLADRVVEAWANEGHISDDDPTREAQRLVAQRCIYGVDRDGMAVEMAKLSLWLLTFSRERPFGFLDHAIREGDSLLGITSIDQVRHFHRDPVRGKQLNEETLFDMTSVLYSLFDEARRLRTELEHHDLLDVHDVEDQDRLQAEAIEKTSIARTLADAIVGVELSLSDRPSHERDSAIVAIANRLAAAIGIGVNADWRDARVEIDWISTETGRRINAGRPNGAPKREPLHWPLEFPEVFSGERSGFDAVTGNPPFLGGKLITGSFGDDYRNLLLQTLAGDRRGHADLVAYFFLRAAEIAVRFGFIATNTIAQGDTREVALDVLTDRDWSIYRAEKSRPWPGAAAIQVSEVWCTRSKSREPIILGDKLVSGISPLLVPVSRVNGVAYTLKANLGIAFNGQYLHGTGFVLSDSERAEIVSRDSRSGEVISPYIVAEDICSRFDLSAARSAIDFGTMDESEARSYGAAYSWIERTVKPQRLASSAAVRSAPWWQFFRTRPELRQASLSLDYIILMPLVSKYSIPVKARNGQVFSHMVAVFATDDDGLYGLISSEVHKIWARSRGSTMRNDTRYTPTDCFETFPLPDHFETIGTIMHELHEYRTALMYERHLGITKLYNSFHSPACGEPEIERLRQLHTELDRSVLVSYGWEDLSAARSFHATDEGLRLALDEAVRIEILDRLLELNQKRYAAEVSAGLHSSRNGGGKEKKKREAAGDDSPSLL